MPKQRLEFNLGFLTDQADQVLAAQEERVSKFLEGLAKKEIDTTVKSVEEGRKRIEALGKERDAALSALETLKKATIEKLDAESAALEEKIRKEAAALDQSLAMEEGKLRDSLAKYRELTGNRSRLEEQAAKKSLAATIERLNREAAAEEAAAQKKFQKAVSAEEKLLARIQKEYEKNLKAIEGLPDAASRRAEIEQRSLAKYEAVQRRFAVDRQRAERELADSLDAIRSRAEATRVSEETAAAARIDAIRERYASLEVQRETETTAKLEALAKRREATAVESEQKIAQIRERFDTARSGALIRFGEAEAAESQRFGAAIGEIGKKTGELDSVFGRGKAAFGPFLSSLREGRFSVEELTGGVINATRAMGPYGVAAVAIATATLGVVKAMKSAVDESAEYAKNFREINKLTGEGDRTGAAIVASFESIGGSIGDAQDLLFQLSQNLSQLRKGDSDTRQLLKDLTFTDEQIDGIRTTGQLFEMLTEKVRELGTLTDKQQNAIGTFAGEEGGRQLLDLANGYREAKERAEEYGFVLDETQKKALKEYSRALGDIEAQLKGFIIQAGGEAAPVFAELAKEIADGLRQLDKKALAEGIGALAGGLKNLGKLFVTLSPFIQGNKAAFELFAKAVDLVASAVEKFDPKIKEATSTLGKVQAIADAAREGFKNLTEYLREQAAKGLDAFIERAGFLANLVPGLKKVREALDLSGIQGGSSADQFKGGMRSGAIESTEQARTKAANDEIEAVKKRNSEIENQEKELQLRLEKAVFDGSKSKVAAAAEYYKFVQSSQVEELKNAERTRDAELVLAGDNAAKKQEAEEKFRDAKLEIQSKGFEAEKALAEAQAAERAEALDRFNQTVAESEAGKLAEVEKRLKSETILTETAARERAEIERDSLQTRIEEYQRILDNEKLTADERKQIESDLRQLQSDLTAQNVEIELAAADEKIAKAREEAAIKEALADQEKARATAAAEAEIAQLRASGATREQIAQRQAELAEQQLALEIRQKEEALKGAQEVARAKGLEIEKVPELIRLETELITLRARQADAAQDTAEAVVAAKNAEIDATQRATNAERERAGAIQGTAQAARQAADAFTVVGQAGGQGFGDTVESVGAAIEQIQNKIRLYTAYLGFIPRELTQKLQEAFEAQAKIAGRAAEEQEARSRESAQRQAEDRKRELDKADEDEKRARERRDDQLAALEDRRKQAGDRRREQETEADKKALDARTDAYQRYTEAVADLDKREAEDAIRRAEERERRIADARSQARTSLLDSEQGFLGNQASLEQRLADLQGQKGGDEEGRKKEIERVQREITRNEDLFNNERLREQEKADALREAQARGASQQEIDILLSQIDRARDSERDYINTRFQIQETGNQQRLAQLEASQARERQAIADDTTRRLTDLQADLAAEEQAKRDQRQRLLDDLNERYQAIEDARLEDYDKAQDAYDKELAALREQNLKILDEYKKTYDEISRIRQGALQPTGGTQPSGGGGNDTGGSGGGPVRNTTTPGGSSTQSTPRNSSTGNPGGGGTGGGAGQIPASQPQTTGNPGIIAINPVRPGTPRPGGTPIQGNFGQTVLDDFANYIPRGASDATIRGFEYVREFLDKAIREVQPFLAAGDAEGAIAYLQSVHASFAAYEKALPPGYVWEKQAASSGAVALQAAIQKIEESKTQSRPASQASSASAPQTPPVNTPQAPPQSPSPPAPTNTSTGTVTVTTTPGTPAGSTSGSATLTVPPPSGQSPPQTTTPRTDFTPTPTVAPTGSQGTPAKPTVAESPVKKNDRIEALISQIQGGFVSLDLAEDSYARFAAGMEGIVTPADLQRIRDAIDEKKGIKKAPPAPAAKPTLTDPIKRDLDSAPPPGFEGVPALAPFVGPPPDVAAAAPVKVNGGGMTTNNTQNVTANFTYNGPRVADMVEETKEAMTQIFGPVGV